MNKKTKIMVFGTFDIFHKGHESFFKQARSLAKRPFLVVSIARDANVRKIKGQKTLNTEKKRLSIIQKSPLVDKVVLGGLKSYIPHIVKEKPDLIVLGYDQKAYVGNLKKLLKSAGLKVIIQRAKAFKPAVYKSSFFKNKN